MAEREDVAANVVRRIVNAWDCCGTCAGGVLGEHVRAKQAEALREAAAQWVDGGLITTDNLRRFLRSRAAQTEARP